METHFANFEYAPTSLARERVLDDLRELVRDSEALLKATAGDVSVKAMEARARLAAALERARSAGSELQRQTAAAARAAATKTDALVREHPYESIGVAFGVGLLIGLLIGRKPRRS
jgi:ElaB/YqjD/DUF883 family membrane-anchored ribosome-binding protein